MFAGDAIFFCAHQKMQHASKSKAPLTKPWTKVFALISASRNGERRGKR